MGFWWDWRIEHWLSLGWERELFGGVIGFYFTFFFLLDFMRCMHVDAMSFTKYRRTRTTHNQSITSQSVRFVYQLEKCIQHHCTRQ